MASGRLLIVDDEASQCRLFEQLLAPLPIELVTAGNTSEAIEHLTTGRFNAVLCDLVMQGGGGLEVLRFVQRHGLPTPIVVVTGHGDEEAAEECLALGAFDFISKPVDRLSLLAVIQRALLRSGLPTRDATPAPRLPREQLPRQRAPQFALLVGNSASMQAVLTRVAKLAEADTNVCVYGESGTGWLRACCLPAVRLGRLLSQHIGRRLNPVLQVKLLQDTS
jgi:DNA-binding NtrC family response regulator